MKIPMLDLVRQYHSIKEDIDRAFVSVLEGGAYIMGPQVRVFEEELAAFLGCEYCLGVASGSDALILSLHALGIGAGDGVIVPTFTFFATAGAVVRLGARPVFADIDPSTYNINIDQVACLLEKNRSIKAIIPVHVFGLPVDMDRLMELARRYNVHIIEDACQAINADIFDASGGLLGKAGVIGDTGCFSFFPSKNLSAYGDAGAVVTNNARLAEQIKVLRVHGASPKYYHSVAGYNSRLDTLQAALLSVKLRYLDEWTQKRRDVAVTYGDYFARSGLENLVKWPDVVPGHVFHQYVIESDHRDRLAAYLQENGISTAVYYPVPLHKQECFRDIVLNHPAECPVAEEASRKVLALPVDPELRKYDVERIVGLIQEFHEK